MNVCVNVFCLCVCASTLAGCGQGEVEQIAMMKPKGLTEHEDGLLEYLEDIIGSDRFVEAAEEAAKKVEGLNDQRTEKVYHVPVIMQPPYYEFC